MLLHVKPPLIPSPGDDPDVESALSAFDVHGCGGRRRSTKRLSKEQTKMSGSEDAAFDLILGDYNNLAS